MNLPKIDGVRCLKGPKGTLVAQIDDIYKRKDLKKLLKSGVRDVVIVGCTSKCDWERKFYGSTRKLINFAEYFRVTSHSDRNGQSVVENFLNQENSENKPYVFDLQEYQNVSSEEEEMPNSDEIYSRWEIWKNKATEHWRLNDTVGALHILTDSKSFLTRQYERHVRERQISLAMSDRKHMAKMDTIIGKMWLEFSKLAGFIYFHSGSDNLSSGACFTNSMRSALCGIVENACREQGYQFIYQVIQSVRAKYCRAITTANENNQSLMRALVEEDVEFGGVYGLRKDDLETTVDDILETCEGLEMQRELYVKMISDKKVDEMIKMRTQLADELYELSAAMLNRLKESKRSEGSTFMLLRFNLVVVQDLINTSFRFSLEALEWDPLHIEAKRILHETLTYLAIRLNEIRLFAHQTDEELYLSILPKIT